MRDAVGVVVPSGTVTFLFTDVEGSTRMWDEHPEEMQVAVERHDRVMRDSIARRGGYVFSTAGDSFSAAFSRAGEAVGAAVDAQSALAVVEWPQEAPIRVRMGLHTGEVQERDGDYFGPAVNVAARVMSRASGGQVLVTDVTGALVADATQLRRLGWHRLRGVGDPVGLAQVVADGLEDEFPVAVAGQSPSQGPQVAAATRFVGRKRELAELMALVEAGRLVTLTGVGGVGKTRLAMELAGGLGARFEHGWRLVELGPVADPGAVGMAVLAGLGLRPPAGSTAVAGIVSALADRALLVVLDNCEHLLGPVADLVGAVLAGTDAVTVVTTSREPLGIAGEQIFPVPSLDPATEGVDLFVAVSRSLEPRFELTDAEIDVVAELARRVDGIPLAVELAAARSRTLTPAELLERLDDRFRLLRGARRGVVDRHRTLQATVEWSYQLLADEEADVFCRLSVFPSWFDLAAVSAVCVPGSVDELDVLDALQSLVDKSLVTCRRADGATWFRLLETLRHFGEERLGDRALIELRDRHLAHFVQVASRARELFEEFDGEEGANLFAAEWDNLAAAVAWAAASDDLEALSELLAAVRHYGWLAVRLYELLPSLSDVLANPHCPPSILGFAAYAWSQTGDLTAARELAERGIGDDADDDERTWTCVFALFVADWYEGATESGWEHLQSAIESVSRAGRPFSHLTTLITAAICAATLGSGQAATYVERAHVVERTVPSRAAAVYVALARAAADSDDIALMRSHLRTAVSVADELGLRFVRGFAALLLSGTLLNRGSSDAAAALRDAISMLRAEDNWLDLWTAIQSAAIHLDSCGRPGAAAAIVGYLDAREAQLPGPDARRRRRDVAEKLSTTHATEMSEGAAMSPTDLLDHVLASLDACAAASLPDHRT